MRNLVAFLVVLLPGTSVAAREHDLSWSEVTGPTVTVAFVAGRCVVLVAGTSPSNQRRISDRDVRIDGASAVLSVRTGAETSKGASRNFQLVVPTSTVGLRRVVFGPERTVVWERTDGDSLCGEQQPGGREDGGRAERQLRAFANGRFRVPERRATIGG